MSDGVIAQILLVGAAASRPEVHDHLRCRGYELLTAASVVEGGSGGPCPSPCRLPQ